MRLMSNLGFNPAGSPERPANPLAELLSRRQTVGLAVSVAVDDLRRQIPIEPEKTLPPKDVYFLRKDGNQYGSKPAVETSLQITTEAPIFEPVQPSVSLPPSNEVNQLPASTLNDTRPLEQQPTPTDNVEQHMPVQQKPVLPAEPPAPVVNVEQPENFDRIAAARAAVDAMREAA